MAVAPDLLQSASDHPVLLGVAAFALIALAVLRRATRKPARPQHAALPPASPPTATRTFAPPPAPEPAEDFPTVPSEGSIEVREVDPLSEANIYLEFGYFEQAAESLRWYLNETGNADRQAMRKLLDIYLQLNRIDDFAEILERLGALGEDQDYLRCTALAGLAADRDNLQLRVVAETYLGLGPERVSQMFVPAEPPPIPELAEPETFAEPSAPPPRQETPQPANSAVPSRRLVEGDEPIAPLTPEEKAVLRAFAAPAMEARLHLAANNLEEAVPALRRAIVAQPAGLAHFTALLKVFFLRREIEEYARTLWQLFAVLGDYGRALRDRLLGMGFVLGHHTVFEALAQAQERWQTESIGRQFGYVTDPPTPRRPFLLVAVSQGAAGIRSGEPKHDALRDAEAYLEFGQIEEALATLEKAVLADPMSAHLYPPLLDLYERMDDLARFTALAGKIKRIVQRPPEEVVPMMSGLYQRLKQRQQQTVT